MIDNIFCVYFAGVIITIAVYVLKSSIFMDSEFESHFRKEIAKECIGPKTYAASMLFFALAFGTLWPLTLVILIKEGRATKKDIENFK